VKRVIWSSEARNDLAEMDAYYRPLNEDFAQRALFDAVKASNFLLQWPRAGQVIADTPHRKWRVARTPYSLIYRETTAGIRIVRVMHAARDEGLE
jgi:plasmid stabilization system protein ParE